MWLGPEPKEQRSNKETGLFLQKNPLAKIVLILDTDSVHDGQLVTHMADQCTHSDYLNPVRTAMAHAADRQLIKRIRSCRSTSHRR